MKIKHFFLLAIIFLNTNCDKPIKISDNQEVGDNCRDIYPDTWVATDALGRTMPTFEEVGPVKTDKQRVVGMFYITWHTQDKIDMEQPYRADVTKILEKDPRARMQADHELWYTFSYHWGEPEMGYFLSQDEYVIRKDMSMLADAGVDVIILDVTNAALYWDEWEVILKTMMKMRENGTKVPQFCFWAFNGPVITVVQKLYDRIYKNERYKDLWFYWDGQPLLLYNNRPMIDSTPIEIKHPNPYYDEAAKNNPDHPHYQDPYYTEEYYTDYSQEVKDFFTLRTMWWGYYEWFGERFVGTEDNWSFGYNLADSAVSNMDPKELVATHNGEPEQFAVTAAQHPISLSDMGVGKSWSRENGQPELDKYDLPKRAYVPWLGDTVDNPTGYGIYFQERWDEALDVDPPFIYLNDWNEWTAGKYYNDGKGGITHHKTEHTRPWLGRENPFLFVDQYNSEFNRGIHPMKGGYTDNFYMQMAQNIRRYKGVRPIPVQNGFEVIEIDGDFSDWKSVKNEFRDTKGDTFHRDNLGYAGERYVNKSGRNDIITSKVAVEEENIYFYCETADNLTSHLGNNWMLLLIDADNNTETGWYGFDFMVNKQVVDQQRSILMRYNHETGKWMDQTTVKFRYQNNHLELNIPREELGLIENQITFDFKWSDNPAKLENPISFCTEGDAAPNRRFNYRFIWKR
ncbi:MAG TPA: hypothetical protein VJ951_07710 [Bacteroidales bacterium]|nr:hypothetical protein [Bacteroidales bacterium]